MEEKVCYYDAFRRTLEGTIISKAKRFNREKCVVKITSGHYIVKPIIGYNKTTYKVLQGFDDVFSCSCQRYVTKQLTCSHIVAVSLYMKQKEQPLNTSLL